MNCMHRNKKSYLIFNLLHKYNIPPTTMQLNTLELVYDLYLYYTVQVFMQFGTLRKKCSMLFTSGRISRLERKNLKF
jgi:hypothetical protein